MKNQLKIQLVRKTSDKTGSFYATAENINLAEVKKKLNAMKVRFFSFDMTKDTCELVIEPPDPKYAERVSKPYPSKDGQGFSTGMWTNSTAKGFITATGGALDLDEAIAALGGATSVSLAIFQNKNKTDAPEDKKPHWNIKISKFVPKQRAQAAQAGGTSGSPM
jgi:hypothetical protein